MIPSPLAGVLVVDLSRHLPGPLTARLLCDLGARVVKVEEPELGDPVRLVPPSSRGVGALAAALLAGIESVALDLKRPTARGVLRRLLERADVLLESFRPGTLARLGLPPERLREEFPRLVVCSISGWGQRGPHAGRAGHDLTYQAMAGTIASTAKPPPLPAADFLGAWVAVSSILAALLECRQTGRGRYLDTALLDAATHGNLTALVCEVERGRAVGEPLPLTGALPCYNVYRTRDGGLIALAALEPKFWRRFCRVVARKDLIARQFDTHARARRMVAEVIAERDRREWERLFAEHDLPAEPVLSVAEALEHPQIGLRGLARTSPDGLFRMGFPALFDAARPRARDEVPELGEHTESILQELGVEAGIGSHRRREQSGIGRRRSLKRLLWRWGSKSS